MDTRIEQMRPIEGSSPDPVNVPQGCSYHPRCPLADSTCRDKEPQRETIDTGHEVACYHWEQSEKAIPYDLEEDE